MISIKTNSLGVDISTSSVKIAEVAKSPKGLIIKKFSEEKIPVSALAAGIIRQPENVETALVKCLSGFNLKKRKKKYVVCTIPDDKVYIQEATFPLLPYKKLKEAIQFKLQSFIPLPINSVYWDFTVIQDKDNATLKTVIAAVPKETVDSFYQVVIKTGLIPISFENSGNSSLRLTAEISKENKLLVDIGKTLSTVSLVEDNVIKFNSSIHTGYNQIVKQYQEYFNIDDDKTSILLKEKGLNIDNADLRSKINEVISPLKQEIIRTLNYENRNSIKYINIVGEGSVIKGIQEILGEGLNASIVDIPVNIIGNKEVSQRISAVLGAAMKSLTKNSKKEINFLPPAASKEIINNIIKDTVFNIMEILSINMMLYISIFLMLIYFTSGIELYTNQKLTNINSTIQSGYYEQFNSITQSYNKDLNKISLASKSSRDWLPVLSEIPSLVPTGITLTSYNIDQQKQAWGVTISGTARDRPTLLQYLNNLEYHSNYLTNASLPITYIQNDKSISFIITAILSKVQ